MLYNSKISIGRSCISIRVPTLNRSAETICSDAINILMEEVTLMRGPEMRHWTAPAEYQRVEDDIIGVDSYEEVDSFMSGECPSYCFSAFEYLYS